VKISSELQPPKQTLMDVRGKHLTLLAGLINSKKIEKTEALLIYYLVQE